MFQSIVLASVFLALSAGPACAYIDFGTGSYVLQVLAASAIGGLFLIKSYFRRIKEFFIRKPLGGEGGVDDAEGPR